MRWDKIKIEDAIFVVNSLGQKQKKSRREARLLLFTINHAYRQAGYLLVSIVLFFAKMLGRSTLHHHRLQRHSHQFSLALRLHLQSV